MEKYAYLYVDIQKEALTDPLKKELLLEINRYLKRNADLKFETHEATVRALKYIIREIEENHSMAYQNAGLMLALAKKYLGEEEFEIGLKL